MGRATLGAVTAGVQSKSGTGSPLPFLRWAGSKRWLVPYLRRLAPDSVGTYYEPFLGSGAIFFSLGTRYESAVLNDVIPGLMNTYGAVRRSPESVHKILQSWVVDSESYYHIRANPAEAGTLEEAARFIYLNRFGFNGLYRENASGRFNVPFGRPKNTSNVPLETLRSAAQSLQAAELRSGDFEAALEPVIPGDFVFLDPPYAAQAPRSGFTDYNANLFTWEDQERLAEKFRSLSALGADVVLVNADRPEIRKLFSGYVITSEARYSSISGSTRARRKIDEIIIRSASLSEGP